MHRVILQGILIISAAGQCGCRSPVGTAGSDLPPVTVPVEGVRLTPQSLQLAGIGDTQQLVLVVVPDSATDQAVTWESADSTVVGVNSSGLITARSAGTGVFVTVTSHDGHHQASVNVGVLP